MRKDWDRRLTRWEEAGLVDAALAARLRDFEARAERPADWRWPVVLAWVFGGILLGAGILLFVAANWDDLPPSGRFALVLIMIGAIHGSGALLRARDAALGHILHGVGTVSLGAGIFLAGQIFNLQEHWPGGVMLWAAGAWFAWILLRDRIQAVFCALLTPVWLAGEWFEATARMQERLQPVSEGLWLLAVAYLGARTLKREGPVRHDLAWIGGAALLPLTAWAVMAGADWPAPDRNPVPAGLMAIGWAVAYGGPLLLGALLRGGGVWALLAAAVWMRITGALAEPMFRSRSDGFSWRTIAIYALCAAACALMAGWGLLESRRERVNLAVAGFGLTVIFFYFDNVMDKLGRSVSLILLGLLFLLGGYALARARRRLLASLEEGGR